MKEDEQARLPDGRMLGYADYGDPSGDPVFFFHGWPSSRYQGKLLHELAAERGLRLLALDRPGVGLSDPLPGRGFASWPDDVAGIADALGIGRFKIYGISGGGPYTLATAAALPERVTAAAVICGAPPLGDAADRANMHWAYRTLTNLKQLRRAVTPGIIAASRWMIARGAERAPMTWMLRSTTDLASHVGHQVQITGRAQQSPMPGGASQGATSTGGSTSTASGAGSSSGTGSPGTNGSEAASNSVEVESVRMVSSSCP